MFEKQRNLQIGEMKFYGYRLSASTNTTMLFDDMITATDIVEAKEVNLYGLYMNNKEKKCKEELIGFMSLTEFPSDVFPPEYIEKYHPEYNRYDTMDEYSSDACHIADALDMYNIEESKCCDALMDFPLICLDRIAIKPQYRNCGFGKEMVSNLPFILKHLCKTEGVIAFTAYPFENKGGNEKDLLKMQKKLYKFYKDCGYEEHKDYGIDGGKVFVKVPEGY